MFGTLGAKPSNLATSARSHAIEAMIAETLADLSYLETVEGCHAATVARAAEGNRDSALYLLASPYPFEGPGLALDESEIDGLIGHLDAIEAGAAWDTILA